jgi:hypothetical protein
MAKYVVFCSSAALDAAMRAELDTEKNIGFLHSSW